MGMEPPGRLRGAGLYDGMSVFTPRCSFAVGVFRRGADLSNATAKTVGIGTPPQRVLVTIDTGSYELWVNPKCIGSPDARLCGTYGHYYPQVSNTSSYLGGGFKVTYGTGEAAGTYYTDTVKFASMTPSHRYMLEPRLTRSTSVPSTRRPVRSSERHKLHLLGRFRSRVHISIHNKVPHSTLYQVGAGIRRSARL